MTRLSKTLAALAGRVVYERHRDEAKTEVHQLRRTLERLLARGATESDLLNALNHDHWQHRIALRLMDGGMGES